MRTRNLFRYLLAALALLGNVSFVVAQQQTRITFELQGGKNYYGLETIVATYGDAMPLSENYTAVTVPQWPGNGYTFGGYYDQPKGKGTQYYKYENNNLQSARTWNKTTAEATLYAYWKPLTYIVTLDHKGGTSSVDNVAATMGQPMPNRDINNDVLTPPTREGYTFLGYYSYSVWNAELKRNEDICWYDEDMNSTNRVWNIAENNKSIEAKWEYKNFTIIYHSNDSQAKTVSQIVKETNNAVNNIINKVEFQDNNVGYQFIGWSCTSTENEVSFHQGETISSENSVISENRVLNLYAVWQAKEYSVTLNRNGGSNGANSVVVRYKQDMPEVAAPTRDGYVFVGYMSSEGDWYYDKDMNSIMDWDKAKDETLYAQWAPQSGYTVTLDHNDGTNDANSKEYIIVKEGENMPLADKDGKILSAPIRPGYRFLGYKIDNSKKYELNGQNNLVSDGTWEKSGGGTLTAQWQKVYTITLDAGEGAIIPTSQFAEKQKGTKHFGHDGHEVFVSGSQINVFVSQEQSVTGLSNARPKKAGSELLGFKDSNGKWVARVNSSNRNITFDWSNSNWNHNSDITLTAVYEKKYTINGGVIVFGSSSPIEVGIDWEKGEVNDLIGAAQTEMQDGSISSNNPLMAVDLRNAQYERSDSKNAATLMTSIYNYGLISPNVLVYVGDGFYGEADNIITPDNKCKNLIVNDRYPLLIPEALGFTADKVTYERDRGLNDAAVQQAESSHWGTLCLPFPISNNKVEDPKASCKMKFYELYGTHDGFMQFREIKTETIEANTPVLYCRTAREGSKVTVVESNIRFEPNANYSTNDISYDTKLAEEVERNENAKRVVEEDWQFKGTLETKKFCTKAYSDLCIQKGAQAEFLAGAEVLDPDKDNYRELYYFKQDKFTHMTSGVTILPYRAYFDRKKIEESTDQIGESKVSSYSILVVDADGTTTDITNLIDNHEAKGNGKIYDLSGRRVKQPVKGSIYIVDGKKKMY